MDGSINVTFRGKVHQVRNAPQVIQNVVTYDSVVRINNKELLLKPGMTAIQVNTKEELPDVIRAVMDAVKQGELDIQIEDVAETGTAELRLKQKPTPVKKAG